MIRGLAEAAVFTGLAVALHLGGLALGFGQGGPTAGGAGGQAVVSLQGGSPATEALLTRWTDPPEVGGRAGTPPQAPPQAAAPDAPRLTATIRPESKRPESSRPESSRPDSSDTARLDPAALPLPESAEAIAPRPDPAPPVPQAAMRVGTLAILAPTPVMSPDASNAPPLGRAPRASLRLEPPQAPPGALPQVGPPSQTPAPGQPEIVPTKARPEPDPNQTASQRPAPPALRAAGTGGGAAAGLSGTAQQAAAQAGRDRLLALWGGRIRTDLERRKHYPRAAAGAGGTAVLRIAVLGDGRLRAASLDKSAGHPALDRAALEAVQGATFPPAPEGLGQGPHDFTFQMTFAP